MSGTSTHSYLRKEAEVMEGFTHSPLAKCMEQHIVLLSTLIAVELIEKAMAIMEGSWRDQVK